MSASKIKRVPLGNATPSLKDILEEDMAAEAEIGKPISDIENPKEDNGHPINELVKPISDIINTKSEIINSNTDIGLPILEKADNVTIPISEIVNKKPEKVGKSDYEKITATLEPKLLWLLDDERRRRRKAKMDYSYSEIIREALTDYFIKLGKDI